MTYDFERGAKVTGSKFYFVTGQSVMDELYYIQRAMLAFSLKRYTPVLTPTLINKATAEMAGILPKFEGDFYETEKDGFLLAPTAETPLVGMHSNEILNETDLPIKYVALSRCFRREAGSAGQRDKGLKRVHEFFKVELFVICKPEDSAKFAVEVTEDAAHFLEGIHVKTRRVNIEENDRPPYAVSTVDLEVNIEGEWVEVASISDTGQNQSTPALIRYRPKTGGKPIKCGLVNGTGLALPRIILYLNQRKQVNKP